MDTAPVSGRRAQYHLRTALPADADCVSGLSILVFLTTYAADGMRADLAREALTTCGVAHVADALADPRQRLTLAESEGHLLAFSQLSLVATRATEAVPTGLELVRLYVHPAFQRHGLGRLLLTDTAAQARSLGLPLWLTAWSENRRALDFYRAVGFRDIGAKPYIFESHMYENRILFRPTDPAFATT
ncbi:MAG TPA: GNAT family N-acetyltransferase [Burkholderiaceae bacterium]|nr:GNAT family N-acetyltransferase [Burkholderiaceae bacterium]